MKTRKEYMDNLCTHNEYYGQFVTESIKEILKHRIGEDKITNSEDEHFNDIPLKLWDDLPINSTTGDKMRECDDFLTLGGKVCIYKAAARMLRGH